MKLGSLFDGSGGFPLAGAMNGIEPVWASEIEPFPVRVTTKRFPAMKHLGDVTKINGAEVEKVDIVTFGSPCQDLSVAGAQRGIHDGERSSLFFEAVRIIKEMRDDDRAAGRTDKHIRPRWAVWENVPGAFSSNGGDDFRAVLQALAEVADPDVVIPRPEKWNRPGCIVGSGWSIAWRILDAQYWGVPQRRKRIYLVADFAGERAGEILFEREGVSGDTEPGGAERKETAGDVGGGAEGGREVVCLNPWDSQTIRQYDANGVYPALASNGTGGQNRQGTVYRTGGFVGRQGAKSGSVGFELGVSPTLRQGITSDVVYDITGESSNSMKSPTADSCFRPRDVSRTLDTFVGSPDCNQGGAGGGELYCGLPERSAERGTERNAAGQAQRRTISELYQSGGEEK